MAGSEPAQKSRLGKLSEADERRLVEAAQQDRACFGAVYEKYFELVYAYVARRVRDRAATEDLTSEVFRKALANLPRFKWTGALFGAWLLRIASNLIADRAKQNFARIIVHVHAASGGVHQIKALTAFIQHYVAGCAAERNQLTEGSAGGLRKDSLRQYRTYDCTQDRTETQPWRKNELHSSLHL